MLQSNTLHWSPRLPEPFVLARGLLDGALKDSFRIQLQNENDNFLSAAGDAKGRAALKLSLIGAHWVGAFSFSQTRTV